QEFLPRDTTVANQQHFIRAYRLSEGRHVGARSRIAALHFDTDYLAPTFQNEIHFIATFPPIGKLQTIREGPINQVCADRRLDDLSPFIRLLTDFIKSLIPLCAD